MDQETIVCYTRLGIGLHAELTRKAAALGLKKSELTRAALAMGLARIDAPEPEPTQAEPTQAPAQCAAASG